MDSAGAALSSAAAVYSGVGHVLDSDGEAQSDFKTTTLRFTNNNFIAEKRDNSQNGVRD